MHRSRRKNETNSKEAVARSTRSKKNSNNEGSNSSTAHSNSEASAHSDTDEIMDDSSNNLNAPTQYKRVNDQSKNRRTCLRIRRELTRDSTPDRDNRTTITNTFTTRATLKLSLSSSVKPLEHFSNIIREMLRELHQADEMAAIIPWKEREKNSACLDENSTLPTTSLGFKTYFNRLYLPRPGVTQQVYINIHIGHNNDFNDIRAALQDWLSASGHGLYYKMLQVEDSAEVGWLLYSTREMDARALSDEIEDMIGIKVGLRWKTIATGVKNISDKTKAQALCIEVSAPEKWKCQRKLLELYSRSIKSVNDYPNGIRMRFVKLKKDAINMKEKSKLDKLRERQRQFVASICSQVTYEILQLDYSKEEGIIPTLRQMIMSITSKNDGITPLFHCVDMDWMQEGFTFQYSNDCREEAETMINTLLPYLEHKFPAAQVEDNFSEEAALRCERMVWCEEFNMVIDPTLGGDMEDIDQEEDLIGFTFNAMTVNNVVAAREESFPTRPARGQRSFMPRDDDSVSTLGGTLSRGLLSPSARQQAMSSQTFSGAHSVASASSTVTMEQYNLLQEQVQQVAASSNSQFSAINDKVSQILSSISVITAPHQPGSASVASLQPRETNDRSSGHEQ